ncbi:hypothetical protein [Rubrivirga litoralis]|uniref:Uncharacterized protein n=1 Tax=Rubrivirga litoralis TaxID=3075598 RepID=A0ABU3BQ39_9BACT|nr:hypothetical protein [Rubrivirga sp. F394]MDT0631411.1 hypothetical protein [Rubrivirga sp. F394]
MRYLPLVLCAFSLGACGGAEPVVEEGVIRQVTVVEVEYAEAPTASAGRATYAPGDTVRVTVENRTRDAARYAPGGGRIERRVGGEWRTWAPVCPRPGVPVAPGETVGACLDAAPLLLREVGWQERYRFRVPPAAPSGTYRYAVTVTRSDRYPESPSGLPTRRETVATAPFEVVGDVGAVAGFAVPRYRSGHGGRDARVSGSLVADGPCLRLAGGDVLWTVVWPTGTTDASAPGRRAVRLPGGHLLGEGDLLVGGGSYDERGAAGYLPSLEEPVPTACDGPAVLMGEVEDAGLVVPRFTPDPGRFYPETFIGGRIVRDGPCLRLDASPPFTYVVVWPPGTTASADGARLADGRVVREGDFVTGGGGFGGDGGLVAFRSDYEVQVPAGCPGPSAVLVPVDEVRPGDGATDYGGLYFPQRTVPGPSASARLEGRLVQHGPCLYVEAAGWDETYLVVWAAGFMPEGRAEGGGPLRVRDVRDGRAADVGGPVVLGGREAGRDEGDLRSPLPAACPGPAWTAGEFGEPVVGE